MRRHSPSIPMTTAVVGIDLAKRRFVAWSGGSTSTARSCGNDGAGFVRFAEYLDGVRGDGGLVVAFEPSTHSSATVSTSTPRVTRRRPQ